MFGRNFLVLLFIANSLTCVIIISLYVSITKSDIISAMLWHVRMRLF